MIQTYTGSIAYYYFSFKKCDDMICYSLGFKLPVIQNSALLKVEFTRKTIQSMSFTPYLFSKIFYESLHIFSAKMESVMKISAVFTLSYFMEMLFQRLSHTT